MVGTRHAVSENKAKADSACRVPTSPNVSKVNGKRKGENGKLGNCATLQNKFLQGVQRYKERNYGDLTMCVCRDMLRGRVGGRGARALHIGTSCAWSCGAIPSCRAMPLCFRQWRQAGAEWILVCATFPFWLLVCQCRTRGRWRH